MSSVLARVRGLIVDEVLREGDPLPSTRAMATQLGVARGTVVAAYEQLDGEGWISTRPGAVARVATPAPGHLRAPAGRPLPTKARTAHALTDLRPGVPRTTAISLRDWRSAWRAAAEEPLRDALPDPAGTAGLREQISVQLALSRGFSPSPDQVIITAGTTEALSLITEALCTRLGRRPVVAVEDPGFTTGWRAISGAGGVLIPVPLDDGGLDLGSIPTEVDAIAVTPSHQYPMGSVMPVARRAELLNLAHGRGAVVLEDDYDSEFRHRGTPVPALATLDHHGVVLHLGSFSKILDPRLRCGYVVLPTAAPSPITEALRAARAARGAVVADPVQTALAHLLRTGALRRHLGRVRRDYAHKRTALERRLLRLDPPSRLQAHALDGGLHVVLTWDGLPTPTEVLGWMRTKGFVLADLTDYSLTTPARQGIVLGYGAVPTATLVAALDALIDAFEPPHPGP